MAYWKDIDIKFRRKNNGDIVDMTDSDAINNSLSNIFTTFQGSRRMLPDFALAIYNLLFQPVDKQTGSVLANLIWDAIEKWETRVIVEGLDIYADADNNRYVVTLQYFIGNIGNRDNIETFTSIIRAR